MGSEQRPVTALQRALEAEHDARHEIEAADAQAREILADARARARAVERRAGDRIARVSRTARAETERLLAEREADERRVLEGLEHASYDADALEAAAAAIARRLTGGPEAEDGDD